MQLASVAMPVSLSAYLHFFAPRNSILSYDFRFNIAHQAGNSAMRFSTEVIIAELDDAEDCWMALDIVLQIIYKVGIPVEILNFKTMEP